VQHDRIPFDQDRLKRLDAHSVQGRRTIQENGVLVDDLFQDVPDLILQTLDHPLGALDRVRVPVLLEPADDERLIELKGDLLGQAALVELHLGPHHDHRTRGVVHPLAQQVLAEPALLALDHVGQALERAIVAAQDRPAAPPVVQQGVHRLLKHPLLVADDHFGGVQVDQLLEPVVPVDDAAVQVIQIAGREVVPLQQHEGPKVRRNHRNGLQDHPGGLVLAVLDVVDQFQPLGQILDLLLAVRLRDRLAELRAEHVQIQPLQETPYRLGPHPRLEGVPVLLNGLAVFVLGQELPDLQGALAGIHDRVVLEVDHLLQVRALHRQKRAQPVGNGLEEPDVHHGGGQVDMPHTLAPHPAVRDLDAAPVADDPLELGALVLAARALPVPLGSEDPLAEQTVLLGPIGPVVDRFGLADLSKRPTPHVVGTGQLDLH